MISSEKNCPDGECIYQKELENDQISEDNLLQFHSYYSVYKNTEYLQTSYKSKRLQNEIVLLRKNLPCFKTNSIFIKYEMDFMKILISGSEGTPYSHGAYVYDCFFEQNYPNMPPKMQLTTTGQGKIRFNPNLYSNGYICLSLLGTWRGDSTETWNINSNLFQILLSLQAIVMSEDIYYNEPGYDKEKNTAIGKKLNNAYQNIVKYGNIKYAMIEQIKNPGIFQDIIKKHFYHKKDDILKTVQEWVDIAKRDIDIDQYSGLVYSHNRELCEQIKEIGFYNILNKEFQELKLLLNQLNL